MGVQKTICWGGMNLLVPLWGLLKHVYHYLAMKGAGLASYDEREIKLGYSFVYAKSPEPTTYSLYLVGLSW